MTMIEVIAVIVAALVVPYGVQLIKHGAVSGSAARWLAIGVSVVAGLLCGLAGGVPDGPGAWLACVMSTVGGVQVGYAAYKSVGVTSKWLDALSDVATGWETTPEDER